MGRRIKVNETGLTDRTITYTYDNLNRLESEEITENGKTVKIEYSFDSGNNRIQKIEDGKVTKYTYDANNRLITEGNKTYNYDKNGNTISVTENGKTTVYTYFDFGKLKSVDEGSTKETYTYDHQGRRTAKETTINGQTEVTNYLLDDNGLVYNVLAEYDNNGNTKTTYTIGNTLISLTTNGNTNYYLTDGTGSTRALADTTGNITDTYTYDAFGNTLTQTGSTYNPYLYNQEQYDQNTGLYYQRARYLNPTTGRFITQDSYGGNTYDPASLHRYNYANANPITGSDPTGYETLKEQATAIAIYAILDGLIGLHLNVIHSLVVAETKIDNGEDVDITKTMQDAAIEGFISGAVFGVVGYKAKCGSDLCKYTLIGVCTYGGTYTGGKAGIELSNGNNKLAGLYAVESVSAFFGAYKISKSTPDIVLNPKQKVSISAVEGGSKSVDDIISGLYENTNGKGVARNFKSSGGYEQTLKDFEDLDLSDVKNINTKYGNGKVGKLSDGSTVVARPGSETGGATLEIRMSRNKVIKIRY